MINIELKYKGKKTEEDKKTTYIDMIGVEEIREKVPVIRYKSFAQYPDVIHGFSTRLGGVSKEHLYSMNLSFSRGDERDNVVTNHKLFGKAVGYNPEKLVFSDQVHDTKIYIVDENDIGKGFSRESDIKEIDGLVTNVRDIPLITFYADCVPLFFYDKVRKVVGLAHSGWKGTVNNIAYQMIQVMNKKYGSKPEDIVVAIGPSICMDCYEVSYDVAEQFEKKYKNTEIDHILLSKGEGKYQLDLHQACKYNLINAGVLAENISMPDACTCCNPDVLYSHRASKGMRGNLAAVIMLK